MSVWRVRCDEIGFGLFLNLDWMVNGHRSVGVHIWKNRFEIQWGEF
ncbi:MAG: hypothetical protein AAF618_00250 [Pseudomonadota bacterium]